MYAQQSFNKQVNWALFSFIILTILAGVYSELFQAPQKTIDNSIVYTSPLTNDFLSNVHTLHYKSRLEKITLQKNRDLWHLTSPRRILADRTIVLHLFQTLKQLKIRKIYPRDDINLNNFSLKDPLLTLTVESNKKIESLDFGIINPVDQTTYVALKDSQYIYQVELLKYPIETFGLSDFIDSRMININKEQIQQISIYKGNVPYTPWVKIQRNKENLWKEANRKELDQEKTKKYLTALINSRSYTIFDELTESQEKILNDFLKKPTYKIKIVTKSKKTIEYSIVALYREVEELKIQKKKHVLVKSNDRHNYLLLDRDVLKILRKSIKSLR